MPRVVRLAYSTTEWGDRWERIQTISNVRINVNLSGPVDKIIVYFTRYFEDDKKCISRGEQFLNPQPQI